MKKLFFIIIAIAFTTQVTAQTEVCFDATDLSENCGFCLFTPSIPQSGIDTFETFQTWTACENGTITVSFLARTGYQLNCGGNPGGAPFPTDPVGCWYPDDNANAAVFVQLQDGTNQSLGQAFVTINSDVMSLYTVTFTSQVVAGESYRIKFVCAPGDKASLQRTDTDAYPCGQSTVGTLTSDLDVAMKIVTNITSNEGCNLADINNDGVVNVSDLFLVIQYMGSSCLQPEPFTCE